MAGVMSPLPTAAANSGASLPARLRQLAGLALGVRVDEAARDGEKTLIAQLVGALLTAAIVAANLGVDFALGWLALALAGEFFMYELLRRYFRKDAAATMTARAFYVLGCGVVACVWVAVPLRFWLAGNAGLAAAAIVVLATSLIHAQAFAYRSLPVLVATGGPAAVLMLLLPWIGGPLAGIEQVTLAFVTILSVGYAVASVQANRATARTLQTLQDELERFAYFDALTSLANRRQFSDNLRKLIALSQRRGTRFALLLLDLDQFKVTNDTLGHDAGDALLIEIGARLRRAIRAEDNVARLGGDEFAILLPGADDPAEVAALCDRLAASCGDTVEFNGAAIKASLSVGIAMFPDNGDQQESLYKSADLALYQAKHSGRNTWRFSKTIVEPRPRRERSATAS